MSKGTSGFSIVEILMSLSVLSISLFISFMAFTRATSSLSQSTSRLDKLTMKKTVSESLGFYTGTAGLFICTCNLKNKSFSTQPGAVNQINALINTSASCNPRHNLVVKDQPFKGVSENLLVKKIRLMNPVDLGLDNFLLTIVAEVLDQKTKLEDEVLLTTVMVKTVAGTGHLKSIDYCKLYKPGFASRAGRCLNNEAVVGFDSDGKVKCRAFRR